MSVDERVRDEMYRQEIGLAWLPSVRWMSGSGVLAQGACRHGFLLHIEHGGNLPDGGFWTCENNEVIVHEFEGRAHEQGCDVAACAAAGRRDWRDRAVRRGALMRRHWLRGSTRADWMGGLGIVLALLAGLCLALICFG